MIQKNALRFLRQTVLYSFILISSLHLGLANQSGINIFMPSGKSVCGELPIERPQFRSFSIMDIPEVMTYVNHYGCDGELGAITIYSTESADLENLEISLDGGITFVPLWGDNFNNLILLDVEAGEYELHIRMADDNDTDNQRYIGLVEVLAASEVDLDKDGFVQCEDINDKDPCVPEECDLTQGVGCDLVLNTTDYEWCHFEDLFDPEQLLVSVKVEDIEIYASYKWSTGDTTSTISVSPISDTYYHVTVSDQTGCILHDSVFVDVLHIPQIDVHIDHQSCTGTPGSIILFSSLGEEINDIEISLDNGASFQVAPYDNFGNIVLFGLALGDYSISIRHAKHTQCVKDLGVFTVEDKQFFDEDADGVLTCEDIDDNDPCVPKECENCDLVSESGFESDNDEWKIDFENVESSVNMSYRGTNSVRLKNQGAYIESESINVSGQKSIKVLLAAHPGNLEVSEGLHLSMSTDGGNTFEVLTSWTYLIDFHNNEWFNLEHRAAISNGVDQLVFRLSLLSSAENDYIYVDDVVVELCEIEFIESESTVCQLINYDDVDAFLGFWNFGGEDAMISTIHPSSGQFSYHIKNGNGQSSSLISNSFSTSGVGQLSVDFNFTAVSMELKEFFSLELSLDGGATFNRYKSWISGEFENGTTNREMLDIPLNTSVDNIIIRFTNYGNSQYDHVYLDDIKIEYCEDTAKRSNEQNTELILVFEKETPTDGNPQLNLIIEDVNMDIEQEQNLPVVSLYPNPSSDYFTLDIHSMDIDFSQMNYRIIDLAGKAVNQNQLGKSGRKTVDVSQLQPGIYTVQVFDGARLYHTQKLIKI